jgi:response regulator RpfG family c-di-GMP phosphodiesterase
MCKGIRDQSGEHFDPRVVDAFLAYRDYPEFLRPLKS